MQSIKVEFVYLIGVFFLQRRTNLNSLINSSFYLIYLVLVDQMEYQILYSKVTECLYVRLDIVNNLLVFGRFLHRAKEGFRLFGGFHPHTH